MVRFGVDFSATLKRICIPFQRSLSWCLLFVLACAIVSFILSIGSPLSPVSLQQHFNEFRADVEKSAHDDAGVIIGPLPLDSASDSGVGSSDISSDNFALSSGVLTESHARYWLDQIGVNTDLSTPEDVRRQFIFALKKYDISVPASALESLTLSDALQIARQRRFDSIIKKRQQPINLITRETMRTKMQIDWNAITLQLAPQEKTAADGANNILSRSISDAPVKYYDVALALAFHPNELLKVNDWLQSWKRFTACGDDSMNAQWRQHAGGIIRVHLVWAYSGDFNSPNGKVVQDTIKRLFLADSSLTKCFSSTVFLSVEVPVDGHLDGSCQQYRSLLYLLSGPYTAMHLMETDLRPVKDLWLERLVAASEPSQACESWWVRGSPELCQSNYAPPAPIDETVNLHINGNSWYALNCPLFEQFQLQMQRFYPPRPDLGSDQGWQTKIAGGCENGRTNEGGYDHAMYRYLHEPINFVYSRHVLDRFQYTYTVANMCEDSYNDLDLAALSSVTSSAPYLIHSKSVFLPAPTRAIRAAIEYVLKRRVAGWEIEPLLPGLLPLVYTGEVDESLLVDVMTKNPDIISPLARNPSSYLSGAQKEKFAANFLAAIRAYRSTDSYWKSSFGDKIYLWTSDFHGGPSVCQMPMYKRAGAVMHAEIDFNNCVYSGYCKDRLDILKWDDWRGFSLESSNLTPAQLIQRFHQRFANTAEFQRIDAFVCSHPAANCQLYLPFNRPLLIHATTRLEFGRHDGGIVWRWAYWNEGKGKRMWAQWTQDLQKIARDPFNVIAANNLYDVKYIKYMTGIDALYIPSWCGQPNYAFDAVRTKTAMYRPPPTYMPSRPQFLVGAYRTNLDMARNGTKVLKDVEDHPIAKDLRAAQKSYNIEHKPIEISFIRQVFSSESGYTMHEICAYKGMIVIPYQVSTMSIIEFYRLNIPMFFPSKKLLLNWWKSYDVLWERIYGWPQPMRPSGAELALSNTGDGNVQANIPDPNANTYESLLYWLDFADWYTLPHIVLFDSFSDLMEKLDNTDLYLISRNMEIFNQQEGIRLEQVWKDIFAKWKVARNIRKEGTPST